MVAATAVELVVLAAVVVVAESDAVAVEPVVGFAVEARVVAAKKQSENQEMKGVSIFAYTGKWILLQCVQSWQSWTARQFGWSLRRHESRWLPWWRL